VKSTWNYVAVSFWPEMNVARMQHSEIRESDATHIPDSISLHPGYAGYADYPQLAPAEHPI